jgi:hypothetical protein
MDNYCMNSKSRNEGQLDAQLDLFFLDAFLYMETATARYKET